MTANTMAKRKWTKGKTTIYNTLIRQGKIEQHVPHKNSNAPDTVM